MFAYSIMYVSDFGDLGPLIGFGLFDLWPCAQASYGGGSASVKVMSGLVLPSTTLWAPTSASSLQTTPVCDLTFPIRVVYVSF